MTLRMFGKTTLVAATVFASVVALSAQGQAGAGAPPAGGGRVGLRDRMSVGSTELNKERRLRLGRRRERA